MTADLDLAPLRPVGLVDDTGGQPQHPLLDLAEHVEVGLVGGHASRLDHGGTARVSSTGRARSLRIGLLGPFEAHLNGSRCEVRGSRQQLIVTALSLARGRVVSTDRLVELIWGQDPPTKPYETVRSYVSHLRRALDPDRQVGARQGPITTRSPGYVLDSGRAQVDVYDFEEGSNRADSLLASGRVEEARGEAVAALDRWRSDDLSDSPLSSFTTEREWLLELRTHTQGVVIDALLASGRHLEAIPELRSRVEDDPRREQPRAQLMIALHRAGRSAEALEVYRVGRIATIEASGLEPSTALRTLEGRILANDPALGHRTLVSSGYFHELTPGPTWVEASRTVDGATMARSLASTITDEPDRAAAAALAAARQCARRHDHQGVIDLIERGLAALERGVDDLAIRSQLLAMLAEAHKFNEHYSLSHVASQDAFIAARQAGELDLMVEAALIYCGTRLKDVEFGPQWLGYWNPPEPALAMLDECLAKLGPVRDRVRCRLAQAVQLAVEHDTQAACREALDEALALARQLDDQELVAGALRHHLLVLDRHLDPEERETLIERGFEVARTADLPRYTVAGHIDRVALALDQCDGPAAQSASRAAMEAAEAQTDPILEMLAVATDISLQLYRGQFDDAERALARADERFAWAGRSARNLFEIQLGILVREQGHNATVEEYLRWQHLGYPGPAYGIPLALVVAEQGRYDEGRQILDGLRGPRLISGGEPAVQFITLALGAELAAILDDRELALDLYRDLERSAGRTVALTGGIAFLGCGSYYLALLDTVLGRHPAGLA